MFPRKFYKHFGMRVKLTQFALCTYYTWDSKKEHLIMAPPYVIWGMYVGANGGFWLIALHIVQMYLKTHPNDVLEEGRTEPEAMRLRDFATLMIEGGEVMLMTCVTFLNIVFLKRLKLFKYLFNELLDYNKRLSELIDAGDLVLSDEQKVIIRATYYLQYAVMTMSTFLPIAVLLALTSKIEPHHQLFEEWMEMPVIQIKLIPLYIMMFAATYGVGTTVGYMCQIIGIYFMTTTICTEAFTPEHMRPTPKLGRGRCVIQTSSFGELPDTEVIRLFRIQQVFNTLMSKFFRSVLISFHHVGLLGTCVVLIVFAIRYNEILSDEGPAAYFVVFSCLGAPLLLMYCQCQMGGSMVDISEDFKFSGTKFFPRSCMFHKFSRSCTTFFLEVTYPFYTIHKETLTEFFQQVQDYSMELLLW